MKKHLGAVFAALAFVALAGPAAAQQQPVRVGYINTQKLLQDAPGTQDVQQRIRTELAPFEQQLRALEDSLRTLQQQFGQEPAGLSEQARTQRQQEFQTKAQGLQQRAAQVQQTAAQKQNELLAPVMQRIEEAISAVRQEGGFAMLFDAATDAIVSADTTLDMTERVLARLRQQGSGQ
ncbi:MAG TPA: OmpH family outer membrane protein [Longimicrobiales bacterium]|nr:OmpH family outer membrane protein [Longimicrobiales bacterium]